MLVELIRRLEEIKKDYGDITVNAKGHVDNNPFDDIVLAVRSQPIKGKASLVIIGYMEDEVDKPE